MHWRMWASALPGSWSQCASKTWRWRLPTQRLRVNDHLVSLTASHGFDGLVDLGQGKTMRDDLLRIHQPAFHQQDGLSHRQRGRAEARVHACFQEVHQAAIERELLVRGDTKDVFFGLRNSVFAPVNV